jgi:hypothetical protein
VIDDYAPGTPPEPVDYRLDFSVTGNSFYLGAI